MTNLPEQKKLDKGEMSVEELIAILQKLPPGTRMEVRAGSHQDDAYVPKVRVWLYQKRQISATIEASYNGHHYNYPEHYNGVEEITNQVLGQ